MIVNLVSKSLTSIVINMQTCMMTSEVEILLTSDKWITKIVFLSRGKAVSSARYVSFALRTIEINSFDIGSSVYRVCKYMYLYNGDEILLTSDKWMIKIVFLSRCKAVSSARYVSFALRTIEINSFDIGSSAYCVCKYVSL